MSESSERLRLVPITRAEAKAFVAKHHRHHRPSLGDVFSIACAVGDRIVGVAMIGRPVAEEGGASLRAAGWRTVGEAGGGSWSRKSRPRVDLHPTQSKIRWEAA